MEGSRREWLQTLPEFARVELATLPTPLQRLPRLSAAVGGPELWLKRDDLSGLPGGGNKTRKLEFVVAEAIAQGCDTLVTVGAIQSNHTRQTAAAAARCGLGCALLHCHWAPDAGPHYRRVGNVLLSGLLGAELFLDDEPRPVGDETGLETLVATLRARGRSPYVICGGASEHPLGGLGYVACAAEIVAQAAERGIAFDAIVHCTGSSSTQAGLLAGLAALGARTRVIGVADDDERAEKVARVARLAGVARTQLGLEAPAAAAAVEVVVADDAPYGVASPRTVEGIRLLAHTEGLIADPVYEGKALRGLLDLIDRGLLGRGERVLLLHLGGSPAVHAYADGLWDVDLRPLGD